MSRQERIIARHAEKLGIEAPAGLTIDPKDGLLHGSTLKFTGEEAGSDNARLISQMKQQGFEVCESKDKLYWDFVISPERYQANLDDQYRRAIEQTRPRRNEVVNPGEEGYFEGDNEYVQTARDPVNIDQIFNQVPTGARAAEQRRLKELEG